MNSRTFISVAVVMASLAFSACSSGGGGTSTPVFRRAGSMGRTPAPLRLQRS
ncbi:MAG TPA: hypothetical protein VFF64_27035 [Candidatus Eremiobacteraceae bacterium]|nr:hypothetical protein [Candidatus Eremiobacteraceae bacterium]